MKKLILSGFLLCAVVACAWQSATPPGGAAVCHIGGLFYSPSGDTESLTLPFSTPSGVTTSSDYSGFVQISVSGACNAAAQETDAFYRNFANPFPAPNHLQIITSGSGTGGTAPRNPAGLSRHIVYDLDARRAVTSPPAPAYRPDHTYAFVIDSGQQTPARLTFRLNDDSSSPGSCPAGAFTLKITPLLGAPSIVPDTGASLSLLFLGVLGLAWSGRRFGAP